jgi:hypothetical protein
MKVAIGFSSGSLPNKCKDSTPEGAAELRRRRRKAIAGIALQRRDTRIEDLMPQLLDRMSWRIVHGGPRRVAETQ